MAYTRKPNRSQNTAKNGAKNGANPRSSRPKTSGAKPRDGSERKTSERDSIDRNPRDRNSSERNSRSDNRSSPKRGPKNRSSDSESARSDSRKPNNVKPSEKKFGDKKRDARSNTGRANIGRSDGTRSLDKKDDSRGYNSRYRDDETRELGARGSGARGSAAQRPTFDRQKSDRSASDRSALQRPNSTSDHKNSTINHKPATDQRMFGAPKRVDQRMFGAPDNAGADKHGVASRKKTPVKPRSRRESFANFDTMPIKPRFKNKSDGTPLPREKGEYRIAKLLARAGVASRREIERMIADGRISLNGEVLETPATMLKNLSGVTVDGHSVGPLDPTRLFLYHKASGLLTAERDFTGRETIYDDLPKDLPRLMPIGRLDLNTEGLLLMTNDGEFKREMELPSTGVERTYRARTFGDISQEQLESLVDGIEIEGVRYGKIDANLERRTGANQWIEMTLTEGKNREVRRVLEHFELQVSRLIRTRYGPYELGSLPKGAVVEVRRTDVIKHRRDLKS